MEEKKERRLPRTKAPDTAIPTVAILLVGLLIVMVVFWSSNNIANELKDIKSKLKDMNATLSDIKGVTDAIKVYMPTDNESQAGNEAAPADGSQEGAPATEGSQLGPVTDVQTVIGDYTETTEATCKTADGKLIVRFYGATYCPHCTWEKPVFNGAVSKFNETVDERLYMLDADVVSDDEVTLWQRYNSAGSVPTIIIGCKYYRIGSGESIGEDAEADAITKLICAQLGSNAPGFCT